MKPGLASFVVGSLVLAAGALAAVQVPPTGTQKTGSRQTATPPGPWTGEWKVVRIEMDTGRRFPIGRLSLVQRGALVCGSWSWNRYADGSVGTSRGTVKGLTMRSRGRDARGTILWTLTLRAEVVDRFVGRFTQGEPESETSVVGSMYGTRIGPPQRRPAC